MDLLPDDEQTAIAASARELIGALSPPERLRTLPPDAPVTEPKLWQAAARQGFFALDVPEEDGGAGLGLAEQTLVFRELGRSLAAGPFLGTVVAAQVAVAIADADLLEQVADGRLPVGLADPLGNGTFRTFDADDAQAFVLVSPDGAAVHDADAVEIMRRRRFAVGGVPRGGRTAGPCRPRGVRCVALRQRPGGRHAVGDLRGHAGPERGVCQGPRPVRPADRLLPGGQAPLRGRGGARG